MIDHVIIRKWWRSSVFGTRSFPEADCGSDHHLVIAKIQLKFKSMWKKATQQHFNIESLKTPEIAQRYQENVQKELTSITQNSKDITITLVASNKSILSAASNTLEQRRSRRKPWISDEVLRLSDARKGLKSKKHESQKLQFQYNSMTRQICDKVKASKEEWITGKCKEAEAAAIKNDSKTLYNKIKEISAGPSKKQQVRAICDNQNNLLTSSQAIEDHWKEYCERLYNCKLQSDPSVLQKLQPNGNHEEEPPLMYGEVQWALHRLKNQKSPGSDGIQAEMLKIGGTAVCQALFDICSKFWDWEIWPELWIQSIIICLFKKGDRSRCENYRTISLINHSSKILLDIMYGEVQQAWHRLKNGKSPGLDGIQAELLKIGGTAVCQALFDICSKIWDWEIWPELWIQSIIICLFKKGDRSRCENYRTINPINHSRKILLDIIHQQLKPHLCRILS